MKEIVRKIRNSRFLKNLSGIINCSLIIIPIGIYFLMICNMKDDLSRVIESPKQSISAEFKRSLEIQRDKFLWGYDDLMQFNSLWGEVLLNCSQHKEVEHHLKCVNMKNQIITRGDKDALKVLAGLLLIGVGALIRPVYKLCILICLPYRRFQKKKQRLKEQQEKEVDDLIKDGLIKSGHDLSE